jgi:HlyD family secretion protein
VPVTKGATVRRGQTLAPLDTTSLQDAVDAAQAQLDQARLALSNALAANAQAATDAASSSQADDELNQARQAVLDGQRDVDHKLAAAQAALESANQVCAAVTEDNVSECQAALNDVLQAQADTAAAQSALAAASNALDALRNQSSNGSRSPSSSGGTATAADLVRYQKDIDAAVAAVAVAKQNVAAATIVSPIDGTIEAVGLDVGDRVTAGSTTSVIKVVGPSGFEVTAIVSVDDLKDLKLGQAATVTPDGTHRSVTGEVVAIGAPRTANGSTTYPVSVGVDDDAALRNGTVAGVAITTGAASTGVAVPTSAVKLEGRRKTVTVLNGNTPKVVPVTVGVVGRAWTQIKTGINAGQRVVLADLNEPLPSDVTSSSNGSSNDVRKGFFQGGNGGPVVEFGPPTGAANLKP